MTTPGPVLLVSVACFFLAACASRRDPSPANSAPGVAQVADAPRIVLIEELAGSRWVLAELDGQAVEAPPEGWPPRSLEFGKEGLRVTGLAGVNRFGGRFEQDGEKLVFGPLAMTRRAGPEELMAAEQRYTQVLSRVLAWRQEGEQLVLITAGDRRAAVFVRMPPEAR